MTCSATLRHNAGEALAASIGRSLASQGLKRGRPGFCARRAAERSMSAFGRGKRRGLSSAEPSARSRPRSPQASPGPARQRPPCRASATRFRLLSPEAPLSFGDVGDVSPLLAALNAAGAPRDDALGLEPVRRTEVRRLAPSRPPRRGDGAARRASALAPRPRPPPRRRRARRTTRRRRSPNPTAGPSLSPMQSALQAAIGAARRRGDRRTRWAPATGAPRARRSRPSTPRAPMSRCGSTRTA